MIFKDGINEKGEAGIFPCLASYFCTCDPAASDSDKILARISILKKMKAEIDKHLTSEITKLGEKRGQQDLRQVESGT